MEIISAIRQRQIDLCIKMSERVHLDGSAVNNIGLADWAVSHLTSDNALLVERAIKDFCDRVDVILSGTVLRDKPSDR